MSAGDCFLDTLLVQCSAETYFFLKLWERCEPRELMLVVNISFTMLPVEKRRERKRNISNIMNILVNPSTSYSGLLFCCVHLLTFYFQCELKDIKHVHYSHWQIICLPRLKINDYAWYQFALRLKFSKLQSIIINNHNVSSSSNGVILKYLTYVMSATLAFVSPL